MLTMFLLFYNSNIKNMSVFKTKLGSIFKSKSDPFRYIDIKAGKMTYGQRIELGIILSNKDKNDFELFSDVFKCLYGRVPAASQIAKYIPFFKEVIEGMLFWIEQESTMLKYEPSIEERRAGIKELSAKVGDLGIIKAIAKDYKKDPDEIFNWEYSKVFGILYTDLEESKYRKRYQEVISNKK